MAGLINKVTDGLRNVFTGMGTESDARMFTQWMGRELDQGTLDIAYRNDWIARKVVDLPAEDATREWRGWNAEKEQITALEGLEKSLNIQTKLKAGLTRSRLYGGAAIVMGINQGQTTDAVDLERLKVGDLQYAHVVSRWDIASWPH
jgi:phage-related protein (TIGR01555 family)